jgi:hypothetical protein
MLKLLLSKRLAMARVSASLFRAFNNSDPLRREIDHCFYVQQVTFPKERFFSSESHGQSWEAKNICRRVTRWLSILGLLILDLFVVPRANGKS